MTGLLAAVRRSDGGAGREWAGEAGARAAESDRWEFPGNYNCLRLTN